MPHRDRFTRAEQQAITDAVRAGGTAACPRCALPFDAHPVPPRADVSYVRDRLWLVCPGCGCSLVVDRRQG